ncbi:MAG: cytochrome c biogenesis protein CcsA [Planifilum fulgidum]|jgi:ABC-type transport system involved in cytochrome c biogenesis permease subunit
MNAWMENLLLLTFVAYGLASIAFVVAVVGRKRRSGEENHVRRWGRAGIVLTIAGAAVQVMFIISRFLMGGRSIAASMFEFTAFLAFALVLAFILIYYLYRTPALGAFVLPLAVVLLAYASVFPKEVRPLIPALQSYWLHIHVTLAALGEGAFAVGFIAGLIYLIRVVGTRRQSAHARFLELTLVLVVLFVGYILVSFLFAGLGYEAAIQHTVNGETILQEYSLPPLIGPAGGEVVKMDPFLGLDRPLFEAPSWLKGEKAASKANTIFWSIIAGLILYGLFRALARKRICESLHPLVKNLDPELVDEIAYRAIAIGFPIFTLGGLIFASIWAHYAWGRFWGWDPKEVWALITWLFYSAYLHLRLSRGWLGLKSSWMAVGGFVILMFNLIAINLVFAGLHSYA